MIDNKLDEKSLEILKILQEKARIPNVEVSRQVGLAPSAVLERIRKLENQGIIDGYEVRLNPERFSRSQISFIRVKTATGKTISDVVGQELAKIPEIQEVHFVAGEDGYLVKARTENTTGLADLLRNDILTIPGVIETKTTTVLYTNKETARIPIR